MEVHSMLIFMKKTKKVPSMRPSFSRRDMVWWCDTCHTPLLAGTCSHCGKPAREIRLTPPGDARPAFSFDIALVNQVFSDHFGNPLIPSGHLALLNKVPDPDRMDEIIVGGGVAGSLKYIPAEHRWEPIPRPEASVFLTPTRRYVVVDNGAVPSIQGEGASVLAPGLIEIERSVRKGDEVFVMDEGRHVVAVGRAKVDAGEAESMDRGAIIRTRRNIPSTCVPGEATWADAVAANAKPLEGRESEAISFIRDIVSKNPIPVNVSYSGGKDSLATLILVKKALGAIPLLFADTGLEFPETYRNVEEVSQYYGMPVIRAGGESAFWRRFETMGPPAVDFRWCCRTAKLTPMETLIRQQWGECLSFIGQRKYESFRRMMSGRVWRNPHLHSQLSAAPIHHWTALYVWLYLFREGAPYNTLYEQGLDRIGCFMCPSSDIAVLRHIARTHPDIWQRWNEKLEEWQKQQGLSAAWIDEARWRIRGVPGEEDSNC
jgi:phosphoadenosine phosphosulfate reductase